MNKSIFKILKMDCLSEEQIIRMKLETIPEIKSLIFDISNRELAVIHQTKPEIILSRLEELNLNTSFVSNIEIDDFSREERNEKQDKKLLWRVLFINFSFFVIEILLGIIAYSMGLVADSLDMLADSLVYALALSAVGKSILFKKKIAKLSGYFQIFLAILGLVEVIKRFIGVEEYPNFILMICVSIFALIGNYMCLSLLQKSQNKEAHMEASKIFTSNDIVINMGVILAGFLVFLTESIYPDLMIGIIIFFIVIKGAINILKISKT
ncbi:MAG: cation transporter [Flavobacteriaceae bacterium]|nr:cation transporter [Flavobacteriaceae bacterium]